jgi:hypothetical protein
MTKHMGTEAVAICADVDPATLDLVRDTATWAERI